MIPSTIANYKQAAAAHLEQSLGHMKSALHLWSPGTGLSPSEERSSDEVAAWSRLQSMMEDLDAFISEEGPGA